MIVTWRVGMLHQTAKTKLLQLISDYMCFVCRRPIKNQYDILNKVLARDFQCWVELVEEVTEGKSVIGVLLDGDEVHSSLRHGNGRRE